MKLNKREEGTLVSYDFRCPACQDIHTITTQGGKITWHWDGDVDAPTVTPSVIARYISPIPEEFPDKVCHFFVRRGRIEYCGDCTHAFAGQTVDMPDWEG